MLHYTQITGRCGCHSVITKYHSFYSNMATKNTFEKGSKYLVLCAVCKIKHHSVSYSRCFACALKGEYGGLVAKKAGLTRYGTEQIHRNARVWGRIKKAL